jgi:hypothetical protein
LEKLRSPFGRSFAEGFEREKQRCLFGKTFAKSFEQPLIERLPELFVRSNIGVPFE